MLPMRPMGRALSRIGLGAKFLARNHDISLCLVRCQSSISRTCPPTDSTLPLAGYRVLDMTRVLAGPYCTQILGDLGAEIIKIEHPTRGDDTRAWGPPYAPYQPGSNLQGPGESAYFLGVNRNKKSLALSFKHPEGIDILHKLAAKCDILVENYLPGSLKKYSMDFETIHKINPSLIYASITGYGQTGPYAGRAGYDVMVEAEFGLMHITGTRDGPPVKVGVAVTDLTTGLYTSNSIMAALLARSKTGQGQHIDVSLSDCQTATLANIASSCLISGQRDSGRWGTAHPSIVPYKSFKTKDGNVLFGGGNDRLFGILCDGLGRPEWKTDPKYSVNSSRVTNRVELEAEIEKISVQKTTQEWLEIFEGKGMPYAAVNDVQDTLNHEHTKARNMVAEIEHEQCGPIKVVNTPVKYSHSTPGVRMAPPTLGQHTDEILGTLLGLDSTSSTGRRPYVPQFSAATQMILSRINSKPGSLSAALSSASTVARSIEQSTFEDAKRRLVMTMNTSLTMPMPTTTQNNKPSSSTRLHTVGDSFHLRPPPPVSATARPAVIKLAPSKSFSSKSKGKSARGAKRKRGKDYEDASSSMSDLSDSDFDGLAKAQMPATMTKSGRQIQKPTQFNPADASGSHKRKNYGKRTAEHALCKVCTRGLSPNMNRIVFCDGCNYCWHQMCHDPYIDDDFVSDENRSWFCSRCVSKREKALAKKKTLEEYKGVSWASKSGEQRRDYLTNLPHAQLVNIIMYSTELHPELPIFPAQETGQASKRSAQGIYGGSTMAGLLPRTDTKTRGPANFAVSTDSISDAKKGSDDAHDQARRESSVDSLPPAWPKVGQGTLAGIELDEDDLQDVNDYEAFSVTTYDNKGRKIMENGMPV
ncbi:CoA-transferase family III [Xylaria nigripes]|nr:CoA-transferase family III [Xylaria nigripes]